MRLREISGFSFRQGTGAGALPPVSAHGFGRGISKAGRIQKQGEKSDLKVRFLEDLNREVLQEFPMNVIGTLVFVSFRP